jgi:hypothetical protein
LSAEEMTAGTAILRERTALLTASIRNLGTEKRFDINFHIQLY